MLSFWCFIWIVIFLGFKDHIADNKNELKWSKYQMQKLDFLEAIFLNL